MKSHIIGFLLVTLAQIPMPIKIGTTFQNKLRPSNRGNSTICMHYEKVWPKMEIKLCVAVDIDAEALFSVLCGGPAVDRCYHNCQAAQNSHSNR